MNTLNSTAPKVLIVGSGPSGLILALSLRRNGIPVRVIEKSAEYRTGSRGAGIMPRSLELFESLGLYQDIASRALTPPLMRVYKMPDGVEVAKEFSLQPWEDPTPAIPYPNSVLLGQCNMDKIMRAELSKCGCEVELGVELQTFEQFDDHVKVTLLRHSLDSGDVEPKTEEATYDWVIGADGARGAVRHVLGLKFIGETTTQKFVVGDVEFECPRLEDRWHMWGDMSTVLASIRATEDKGIFNFIVGGADMISPEEICQNHETVISTLKHYSCLGDDVKFGKVTWVSPFRLNVRMTETFHKGRVFLVGDAGHIHSPTGGQGMNTGVQDSYNLGWKLALVIKGVSSPSLLESFNEERVPVVTQMLDITKDLLQKTIANEQSGWNRSGPVKQLGVNYRWSSIVVDDEKQIQDSKASAYDNQAAGTLAAGDRAPDASELRRITNQRGQTELTRLFQLFSPAKHTVLIFAGKSDYRAALDTLEVYPADLVHSVLVVDPGKAAVTVLASDTLTFVEDTKGYAHDGYKVRESPSGIFVIRPDGVVGARLGSAEGISRYFKAIFDRST
ncbi:hypothetical protein HYPSUDRAFT_198983 [Hypholoma sublateritium FD-334 SS-4]|uniref:FAD-binding domain-containing protein n=1 Tax=Hypholoma sublateritium (strain FD-334 SS-4) TaxID=945553 RepID=A0A0D2P5P7_HYPSF|nr:hypothetical protein HYPSUDRAFT_198983 [Hypholoma sublateritium FD-334 SS-4]